MKVKRSKKYLNDLLNETRVWDKAATDEFSKMPPDYKSYQKTDPYKFYRNKYVMKMLRNIKPKDRVLELGCYNGWFTLEMARRGAIVEAHDVSSRAISIAKNYYNSAKVQEKFAGKIKYIVSDLNFTKFKGEKFDAIVIRNVLHHLVNLNELFISLKVSLKPNGKILVDDAIPVGKIETLITGFLLFVLPTDIPYKNKLKRILKSGQILKRTQGLIDACGASPFEGISGAQSLDVIKTHFTVIYFQTFSSFVGSVSAHLSLNGLVKNYTLFILNLFDILLTKLRLLKGTCYYLVAVNR